MSTLFLKKFQGSFVELVINLTMTEELENGDSKVGPLILQSFVVDIDDKFVYLGQNPLQVDSAIKIDDIRLVNITDPSNYEDDILDPERDKELN